MDADAGVTDICPAAQIETWASRNASQHPPPLPTSAFWTVLFGQYFRFGHEKTHVVFFVVFPSSFFGGGGGGLLARTRYPLSITMFGHQRRKKRCRAPRAPLELHGFQQTITGAPEATWGKKGRARCQKVKIKIKASGNQPEPEACATLPKMTTPHAFRMTTTREQ